MSRGKVIAVANMKGGVGKTTTVVMLAEALAASLSNTQDRKRKAVLVIDADAQSSASYCIAGDDIFAEMIRKGQTVDAYLTDRFIRGRDTRVTDLPRSQATETSYKGELLDVSLLACGIEVRRREREILVAASKQGHDIIATERMVWDVVSKDLDALCWQYDYVIFDCAPGMSLMSDIAVRFADLVVAACMPDHLSRRGLEMFIQTTWRDPSGLPPPRRLPHVLVTRYQQNVRQHKRVLELLQAEAEQPDRHWVVMDTRVPVSAHLAETLEPRGAYPTLAQRYKDLVPTLLEPITDEIRGLLHGH